MIQPTKKHENIAIAFALLSIGVPTAIELYNMQLNAWETPVAISLSIGLLSILGFCLGLHAYATISKFTDKNLQQLAQDLKIKPKIQLTKLEFLGWNHSVIASGIINGYNVEIDQISQGDSFSILASIQIKNKSLTAVVKSNIWGTAFKASKNTPESIFQIIKKRIPTKKNSQSTYTEKIKIHDGVMKCFIGGDAKTPEIRLDTVRQVKKLIEIAQLVDAET